MGTHNICFCEEIRKISAFFWMKNPKNVSYLLLWFWVEKTCFIKFYDAIAQYVRLYSYYMYYYFVIVFILNYFQDVY